VFAFVEAAAGHSISEEEEDFPRIVWSETEGNPFFVAEVLRHLTESGTVAQRDDGRWFVTTEMEELGIPEGVRDVVGRRLSRLSDEANRALAVASVVGLVFEPNMISAAGDLEEDALLAVLEEAVAAALLTEIARPVPQYRFSHALVRATLYDELSAARRVSLHRRVAETIEMLHGEALDDHLPALAHHWSRAAAPAAEVSRAVEYAIRAGDRALAQLAHDEAAGYYRQALGLLELTGGSSDEHRRLELLISLGEAQRRSGDAAYRETLLDAGHLARQQGDADAMARAALANSRGTFSAVGGVDAERVEALEAALDALGDADPSLRARLLGNLALETMWSGDADERRAFSDEALTLARGEGDQAVFGVIMARWATLWNPRWARERFELAGELLAIADRAADPYMRFWGLWRRSLAGAELGDTAQSAAGQDQASAQADDLGQPFLRCCVGVSKVVAAVTSGRLADAEQETEAVLTLLRDSGQPDTDMFDVSLYAGIRYEQGRLGELEAVLRETAERLPAVPFYRALLALALCELDRREDARSAFAPLTGGDPGDLIFDYYASPTAALLAMVSAELGEAAGAARLVDIITRYGGQVASHPMVWFGSFAHHLGLLSTTLERFADAEAHFRSAAAAHERLGAPTWLARPRLEWARMLLRRDDPGDTGQARDLLRSALEAARDLGLAGIERRAAALLA
jgi:tetratricopeptide (TPR) repeat protein